MDSSILFQVIGSVVSILGLYGVIQWRHSQREDKMRDDYDKKIAKVEKAAKEGREKLEQALNGATQSLDTKMEKHEEKCEHRIEECHHRINEMMTTDHADKKFDKLEKSIEKMGESLGNAIKTSAEQSMNRWSEVTTRLDQLSSQSANRASNVGNANTQI